MNYPHEFSEEARNRIVSERLRAKNEFKLSFTEEPPSPWTVEQWDECAFDALVLRTFGQFAREVIELGVQGKWGAERMLAVANEFLRRLTIQEFCEFGRNRFGRELRRRTGTLGDLLPEVRQRYEDSDAWRQFEKELLTVAERQSAETESTEEQPAKVANGAKDGGVSWQAIEISFLSDERVQIRNGTDRKTWNYSELGFADRRNGKPNGAWLTLRALAQARGILRDGVSADLGWPKVEKRMQGIRKALREHFSIAADPVPFVKGTGYQACFKIGCGTSFDT